MIHINRNLYLLLNRFGMNICEVQNTNTTNINHAYSSMNNYKLQYPEPWHPKARRQKEINNLALSHCSNAGGFEAFISTNNKEKKPSNDAFQDESSNA